MARERIVDQLRRNAVALISLVIALTSLGYNTWRNEYSEFNRNQRWASFEILMKLGELQELVFLNHYDCNTDLRGNARTGWVIVQTIQDLTLVLEEMNPGSADRLQDAWAENWEDIAYETAAECDNRSAARFTRGEAATVSLRDAIKVVREDVLRVLYSLD